MPVGAHTCAESLYRGYWIIRHWYVDARLTNERSFDSGGVAELQNCRLSSLADGGRHFDRSVRTPGSGRDLFL
jgi:hypothetical protein